MKRVINTLCILSAVITSGLIICTFATSYQFFYVAQIFNSYVPIQIGGAVTMVLLGLKFWVNEIGYKKHIYTLVSILISMGLIISMTFVK